MSDIYKNGNSTNTNNDMKAQIFDRLSAYHVPAKLSTGEALLRFKERRASAAGASKPKPSKTRQLYTYIAAVAAVMAIVATVWLGFLRTGVAEVIVANGSQSECKLPDGTEVSLNAGSKMLYDKKKFDNKRLVSMEGEAFFKVKKGSTFTINTPRANIQILGTSFNVFARNNQFKVVCVTGRILVSSAHRSMVIVPGESASLVNKELQKCTEKDVNNVATWMHGEFTYENTALGLIFSEIERQFNVNFALPDISNMSYTGSFSNKNLVDALDIVCIPMGLTYEIGSNSKITIHTKSK